MISFALLVAAGTLAAGVVVGLSLVRLPTLRLQLAGLALAAVGLPLTAVVVSGLVMFHSGHDLAVLAVAAGASALAAVAAALAIAQAIGGRLAPIRRTVSGLAAGELSARAPEQAPRELAELARAVNTMAEQLERLFDARRELVAWASHDLRTPIASMQAMLEALEDGLVPPGRYLPELRRQVTVLSRLVDDLFELARIDSGSLTLELREAELASLVEGTVRGFEAEASARRVRLEAHVEGALRARCEPDKVQRVLFNLLTNALRHTPSDGAVAVRAEPEGTEVRVTVEDDGEGLGQETRGRMFERFWRGDPARSAPGAGLGLAIARGLVEAQGGRIWAENRPGGGARISFTLPGAPR